jgi:hypothetical protein
VTTSLCTLVRRGCALLLLVGCATGDPARADARGDTVDVAAIVDVQPDRVEGPDIVDVPMDTCAPRETCNDRDDDCDGVVDDGCPRSVTVSMPPTFGPPSLGGPAPTRNPPTVAGRDEVVVGFYGHKSTVIDQLGVVVRLISLEVDTSLTPFGYRVRVGAPRDLPAYGGTGGAGFRETCPDDTVLTTLNVQHRRGCTSPGVCYDVVGDLDGMCEEVTAQLSGTAWDVHFTPRAMIRVTTTATSIPRPYTAPPGPYGGLWLSSGAFVDELTIGQVQVQLNLR